MDEKPVVYKRARKSLIWGGDIIATVNTESSASELPASSGSSRFASLWNSLLGRGSKKTPAPSESIKRQPKPQTPKKRSAPKGKTTELHRACVNAETICKIRNVLRADPCAAGAFDEDGFLPLHLLGFNNKLIKESIRTHSTDEIDSFVLDELIMNDPLSIETMCPLGFVPFAAHIFNWVESVHRRNDLTERDLIAFESGRFDKIMPGPVTVPPAIEWCFHILSSIIVDYKKKRNTIVDNVASINSLVKSVLFIADDEMRGEILESQIMKAVILNSRSCGAWLQSMAKSQSKDAQEKAVEYLTMISDNVKNNDRSRRSVLSSRKSDELQKYEVYMEYQKTTTLIVSVLKLPENLFREAAATDFIQWSLDQNMFRPMSMFIMSAEILFLLVIAISYTISSNYYFGGFTVGKDSNGTCQCHEPRVVTINMVMIVISCVFFITRDAIAIWHIPYPVLRSNYVLQFVVELAAVGLTLSLHGIFYYRLCSCSEDYMDFDTCSFMDKSRSMRCASAFALLAIFFKILLWVKMVNRYLATFVLTIVEITKDIVWFLLVLCILLLASGLMFHTILYQPWSDECKSENGNNPFCERSVGRSILEMYIIIFGEFTVACFYTDFSIFLFVLYTFLVVILMLNVLIAIVSESYDKSALQSSHLFGRTRVLFVAELLAFQRILRNNIVVGGLGNAMHISMRRSGSFRMYSSLLNRMMLWIFRALLGKSSMEVSMNNQNSAVWDGRLRQSEKVVHDAVTDSEARVKTSLDDSVALSRLEMRHNIYSLHSKIGNADDNLVARVRVMEDRLVEVLREEVSKLDGQNM